MPDDSTINFDVAEKYSYVYADEKFGKLAVTATGDAKLVDPLAWSYAETHSYVKVDPSSVGVEVPSGVTELYAKVIYAPGIGGGSGGSSSGPHTHKISDITNLNASLNSLSSSISTNSGNISNLSSYAQNKVISISNDIDYLSSAIDGISFDSLISSITINSENISYLSSTFDELSIQISNIKECQCDPQDVAYISGQIDDLQYQITEANNDSIQSSQYILNSLSGYATKDDLDNVILPTKVSELENDEQYVPLSAVQQMIVSTVSSLNVRLAKLEATSSSGETNLGERDDELNTLEGNERADGGDIIEYSDRVPVNADDAEDDSDMTLQELAEMYNQKIAKLEAKIQDSVVDLGEHSDNLENLNIDERNATDSQSNGIIFGDRI